jgi:hypothetical protein
MAEHPSPFAPNVDMQHLINANRQQVTSAIASAIMISSGRRYSIQQALEIMHDVHHAMYPVPNSGAYAEWSKTREARLNKVYEPSS